MSERYQSQRNYEQAIKYYREALQHQPDDANALLALARLYMQVCVSSRRAGYDGGGAFRNAGA